MPAVAVNPAPSEGRESKSREYLETLLRNRKLDHTLSHGGLTPLSAPGADARFLVPTGIPELDARLEGGLPRGHLSEIVGPRSSGRLAIVVSALARATARGEAVALIDPLDMFDPVSASATGIDFQRMLWIRGDAVSSARVSLSCEYGTLQKSLDRAVKSLNIVLQAGGFGLVVLDLGEVAAQTIKRLPYTTWVRLQRVIEGSETACMVIGSEPIARSAGGVTVQLAAGQTARVIRARKVESDQHVRVPLSAAAC
jgi:recombination protein RecA